MPRTLRLPFPPWIRGTFLLLGLVITLATVPAAETHAQIPGIKTEAAPEKDEKNDKPEASDPLGRNSPLGMITGFLAAAEEENYELTAQYLDLSDNPNAWAPGIARQIQRVLDRRGFFYSRLRLSWDETGRATDGVVPVRETVGSVRTENGSVDLIAERVSREGKEIWLFSKETVAVLMRLSQNVGSSLLDKTLPIPLKTYHIWGAPAGHWLAIVVLIAAAYGTVWGAGKLFGRLHARLPARWSGARQMRVVKASAMPLRLLSATVLTWMGAAFIGVSIVARQQLNRPTEILVWVVFGWILWRTIDAVAEYTTERLSERGRFSVLSALTVARRSAKVAIVVFAGIAALDSLGFNVTTGLAALGIGGIAIALGAQKTIENFVGSLTLVADQPVRVGDFCSFGGTLGTVQEIGMRSTKVRTLHRTIVTIPNGQFSSLSIENYTWRDRFWFNPTLNLRYETSPEQLRILLAELRQILLAHHQVDADPARVRLIGFGEFALKVEIFAYVNALDYNEFLFVQEELMLSVMECIAAAGTGFALPSRTVYQPPEPRLPGLQHPAEGAVAAA